MLEVADLKVRFSTNDGTVNAVNGVSFSMEAGETLAIVGESGSGKSQAAFAMLGLLARNGHVSGSVRFDRQELLGLPDTQFNQVRARKISIIFQDPMTSLNPYMRIADQMQEVLIVHERIPRRAARDRAIHMLDAVRIPDAKNRVRMYPHEFSGGMRQRVMIAMALLCRPQLLIADEPTTALDVTVQAQIMALLDEMRREFDTALILITHDLGLVAGACDRTMVMYGGRILETGSTAELFMRPTHPYTQGLLMAVPRLDSDGQMLRAIPGDPPDMLSLPDGCPFEPRCNVSFDLCRDQRPRLEYFAPACARACHLPPERIQHDGDARVATP